MDYYLKTNNGNILLDDKNGIMISIFIINKILKDNRNYCLLENIYKKINLYAKKNNIFLYKNNKYRNLNTYIKSKYKNIKTFLLQFNNIYKIENDFLIKI